MNSRRAAFGLALLIGAASLTAVSTGAQGGSEGGRPRPTLDPGKTKSPRPLPPAPAALAAVGALERLRTDYVAAYNRKDAVSLAALYAFDAVAILPNGSVLQGRTAIRRALVGESATWGHMIAAPLDLPEPAGRLGTAVAWSVGTTISASVPAGGRPPRNAIPVQRPPVTAHYLAVIGPEGATWKIKALASVDVAPSSGRAGAKPQ